MRTFFIVLVLAVAVHAVATYILGGQVRDRYDESLQELNASGLLRASSLEYKRGLFSSTARTRIEIPGPQGAESAVEGHSFVLRHVLRHGPLPVDPEAGLLATRPMLALVRSSLTAPASMPGGLLQGFPELTGSTSVLRVAFDGSVAGDLTVPTIERRSADGSLTWDGLRIDASVDSGGLRAKMTAPTLSVLTQDEELELRGVTGVLNLSEILPHLYVGQVAFDAALLAAGQPGGEGMRLEQMRLTSDSGSEGGRIHAAQTVDIARIVLGGDAYGPLRCEMEARNLDGRALSDFQFRIRELSRTERDSERLAARMQDLVGRLLQDLLAGSPEFRIPHLRLTTPQGDLTGAFSVRLDAPGPGAVDNPLLLLAHLDASVEATAHESLVQAVLRAWVRNELGTTQEVGQGGRDLEDLLLQQYTDQLNALVVRNLLVRDGDSLRVSAIFSRGRLTLNGQDLSLF